MRRRPRVLVVEDGHEYIDVLSRFLGADIEFARAGDGPEALRMLAEAGPWDAVFLDMRFDRAEVLLGDLDATARRFAGDRARARRHLEEHQGAYVLAAIREAGHRLPVVISHDFGDEPRRFAHLARRYGPVAWLSDAAGPAEIRAVLLGARGGG